MFEMLLKGTDLLLSEEERISYMKEAYEKSSNDEELIKNYANIVGNRTRSSCPIDRRKEIFSLVYAYTSSNIKGDYLLQKAVGYWRKRIFESEDIKELAGRVYEMLKPEWNNYLQRFDLSYAKIDK